MEAIATTCHSTFFVLQIARWRALIPPVIQLSLCYRQGDGGNCYHLSFNFLCVTDSEMEGYLLSFNFLCVTDREMEAIATTCHSTFFVLQIARWRALIPPVIQLSLCYRQGDGGNCYHLSFNFLCVTDSEMEGIATSCHSTFFVLQTGRWRQLLPPVIQLSLCYR